MLQTTVIELQYFPPISYFHLLSKAEKVLIEIHENFQKQSYRNRCYILTANGVERLTVPVIRANSHIPIQEIEIDYKQNWENQHWRAIQSAYAKAPFFEFYAEDIEAIIFGKYQFLNELNNAILSACLKLLHLQTELGQTDSYLPDYPSSFTDLRNKIHPKSKTGIVHVPQYIQVFGNTFYSNLSVLDLLFCEGSNASQIIQNTSFTIEK